MDAQKCVLEHYKESLNYFDENHIVGIFLQGSQNYELDLPTSDVDTKLVMLPTFQDVVFNRAPISTTHVRENNEHIDFKDIRLMFQTFRKQNINFLEILFTKYCYINPMYTNAWNALIEHREAIAHYNVFNGIKAIVGMAEEKYHALEHRYPAKVDVIDKFGYDPKQLHHLLRLEEFIARYLNNEAYADCLISKQTNFLKEVKQGCYSLEEARERALSSLTAIKTMAAHITKDSCYNKNDSFVDWLLNAVQMDIMTTVMKQELNSRDD